jgi:hypothetical protein
MEIVMKDNGKAAKWKVKGQLPLKMALVSVVTGSEASNMDRVNMRAKEAAIYSKVITKRD